MIDIAIVDDEPLAREIIRDYVAEIPDLNLVFESDSLIEFDHFLTQKPVNVLILDIEMPKLNGMTWAKTVNSFNELGIVFCSAYSQFVSDSYEIEALDYLLKPVSFERFLKSVTKIRSHHAKYHNPESILIRVDKAWVKLRYNDILYIEGMGDYVKIHTQNGNHVTQMTMKQLVEDLPSEIFFRSQKSYIVQKSAIDAIHGNRIAIGSQLIPVSPNYKDELLNWVR